MDARLCSFNGGNLELSCEKSLLVTLPLAVVAIGSEVLQIPRWIPGTFDIVDLFCYFMAIWLGYIYICFINRLIKERYEISS